MKKLLLLVLFCCGIVLATPVQAWQIALSRPDPVPLEQHRGEQHGEQHIEGDRLFPAPTGIAPQPLSAPSLHAGASPEQGDRTALRPFDDVVGGADVLTGLFAIYRNKEQETLYLEIRPDQLNRNFLLVTTLASGVGEVGLFRGWPLRDFVFQLRRVQNQIQFVVPNTNFRIAPGDPQWRSVERSFSDSVLYTLPIQSIHPDRQTLLIDLNPLLLSGRDLPGLTLAFPWVLGSSYVQDNEASYVNDVQAFPLNVELEIVQGFTVSRDPLLTLETLPDPRAFTLNVRYSLSQLPTATSGYRPRPADERIGYFLTAYQDLSQRDPRSSFVRYIHRWHLEPQDSNVSLSPPKEPIVFWLENTVPSQYRDAIREGVLMWNQAFERIGFQNAIEVRQMPDDATWDPADVRYNTIRWSNSFQSPILGIGPSRSNPITGQILDADVILDANATRYIRETTELLIHSQSADTNSALIPHQLCTDEMRHPYLQWLAFQQQGRQGAGVRSPQAFPSPIQHQSDDRDICFSMGASQQMAFGAMSLAVTQNLLPSSDEMQEYVHQFLRWLTAHEVGHVLGLRHNFRGSTMLMPEDLDNPDITRDRGLVGSVMDYLPVNLAQPGEPQGDYFPTTLGPYDFWAIEYGYKPVDNSDSRTERRILQQIAQRSSEPGLAYATDEDRMDFLDTDASLWDLSGDMLRYSQWQLDHARTIWSRLERRYPLVGESYSELRDRFNTVFDYYILQVLNTTRYIGGQQFNRDRRGDPTTRLPFEFVPIAKQREALSILQRYVFAADAFTFSPDLLNRLAPSRWFHWGSYPPTDRLDYPIYDNVLFVQTLVLSDLLDSARLARLRDAELRAQPGAVLTLPELFDTLQQGIWTEVMQPESDVMISSLRRGLQRQYLNMLVNMTLRNSNAINTATNFPDFITALRTIDAPDDARVLARYQLRQLQDAIARTLRRSGNNMDTTTLAHLEEASDRIGKALDAPLQAE